MNEYRLMDLVRDNDVSVIYRAVKENEHIQSSLTYMVKRYKGSLSEELFQNEMEVSQKIEESCPKSVIIPILERTIIDGENYAVMQFRKNGIFLDELIERLESHFGRGKIPVDYILEITTKILESLAVFHQYTYKSRKYGFLHLDLNPGNIFLESADPDKRVWGQVKFIDFGSSVEIEQKRDILNQRNWICSTPGYSAPEIQTGIESHILISTDLYAVSMCMVRMILGKVPVDMEAEEIKSMLTSCNPAVSFLMGEMLDNSICSPSYYRYQNARQMNRDIHEIMECLSHLKNGRYFDLLETCYERSVPAEDILGEQDIVILSGLYESVETLREHLIRDSIHYLKCTYIYEGLHNIFQKTDSRNHKVFISLLNSGLSCYNGTGQTAKSLKVYEELFQYQGSMSVSMFVTTRLRYAVTVADCYEFNKSYDIVTDVIHGLEYFKKSIGEEFKSGITELGRAYSAAGTYLALMNQGDSMEFYEKAIHEFRNDQGNCAITYSKILHYAVQIHDQELYEVYSSFLFGKDGTTLEDQFHHVTSEDYNPYDLFIFMKGIYAFYRSRVTDRFISDTDQFLRKKNAYGDNHPMQLIYKYFAFILYEKGRYTDAEFYIHKSTASISDGRISMKRPINMMMLMTYHTLWQFNALKGEKEENVKIMENLLKHCEDSGWTELEKRITEEGTLDNVLRHEYC